jgi:hypothetical protein
MNTSPICDSSPAVARDQLDDGPPVDWSSLK